MTDQPTEVPFTLYAAFGASAHGALPEDERAEAAAEAEAALGSAGAHVRGTYTTSGFRAETDLFIWLVGPTADSVQALLSSLQDG